MKVVFLTIALDAMPWIASHYWQFQKLPFEWEWRVIEGVAGPVADTGWIRQMSPRLSEDGTTQFLDSIAALDPRVILFRKSLWPGKVAMLNAALKTVNEPCLLMEVDSDEIWTSEQISKLRQMFIDHPEKNMARFFCTYMVGPKLKIVSRGSFGNMDYEWNRAWRVSPGVRFKTHEPPVLENFVEQSFTREETEKSGLVFAHFAYATEAQVLFKQDFYGSSANPKGHLYAGLVEKWRALQNVSKFPVKLQDYFPFVDDGAMADRV